MKFSSSTLRGVAMAGLLVALLPACAPAPATDHASSGGGPMQWSAPPTMQLDTNTTYQAVFTTEAGQFTVRLFAEQSPVTVNNFVFLARQRFYDNTTFHRVIPGFMAQGGDPTGSGAGGPGYTFPDEFGSGLAFDRPGLLAMANRGPNTNGSQFFITYAPTPHLDGLHTIFGQVVDGAEVVASLTPRDPQVGPSFSGDTLISVEIIESNG